MSQFDWSITQKKWNYGGSQNIRFYFEIWSSSPLANICQGICDKWGAMENMLGNTLGTSETYWEFQWNIAWTHWHHQQNKKKMNISHCHRHEPFWWVDWLCISHLFRFAQLKINCVKQWWVRMGKTHLEHVASWFLSTNYLI